MDQAELELVLYTTDRNILERIQKDLTSVSVVPGAASREPVTVLTVLVTAAAAVQLATALLELRQKWLARAETVKVELRNEERESVDLKDATEQKILHLCAKD